MKKHIVCSSGTYRNVREVSTGFECGIGIEGYIDFQVGDVIEFYGKERVD